MQGGTRVGSVTHYYTKLGVAVLQLTGDLKLDDQLHFLGKHTDFPQQVVSLQVDHKPVKEAGKGSEVAIKVDERVRRGDAVFRMSA